MPTLGEWDSWLDTARARLAPYEVPTEEREQTIAEGEVGQYPGDDPDQFLKSGRKEFTKLSTERQALSGQVKKARAKEKELHPHPKLERFFDATIGRVPSFLSPDVTPEQPGLTPDTVYQPPVQPTEKQAPTKPQPPLKAPGSRFHVEDGEIIDTKRQEIVTPDQFNQLSNPQEKAEIERQLRSSGRMLDAPNEVVPTAPVSPKPAQIEPSKMRQTLDRRSSELTRDRKELDALQGQLEALVPKLQIRTGEQPVMTDEAREQHEVIRQTFNQKVQAFNAKRDQFNALVKQYNTSVNDQARQQVTPQIRPTINRLASSMPEGLVTYEHPIEAIRPPKPRSFGEILTNAVNSYRQQGVGVAADALKWISTASKDVDALMPEMLRDPRKVEDRFFYKAGAALDRAAKRAFPTDPAMQKDFVASVLPGAFGSMTAFLLGGTLGAAVKAPGAVAALLGATSQGAQQYEEARQFQSDDDTKRKAFWLGTMVGTTEGLPIKGIFDRYNRATGGTFYRVLKESGVTAAQEAIQEWGQQVGSNAIAQQLYDENRNIFENAGVSAGAGGAVGAVTGVLSGLLQGRKIRKQQQARESDQSESPFAGEPTLRPTPLTMPQPVQQNAQPIPQPVQQAPTPDQLVQSIPNQLNIVQRPPFLIKQPVMPSQLDVAMQKTGLVPQGTPPVQQAPVDEPQPVPGETQGPPNPDVQRFDALVKRYRMPTQLEVAQRRTGAPIEEPIPWDAPSPPDALQTQYELAAQRLREAEEQARFNESQELPRVGSEIPILPGREEPKKKGKPSRIEVVSPPMPRSLRSAPSVEDIHEVAESNGILWDGNKRFMDMTEDVTGKRHLDELTGPERAEMVQAIEAQPKASTPDTVMDHKARQAEPEPTEPQKNAGNYKKGHVRIAGLDISIENPQGSTRSGTDPSGKPWSQELKSHYGYIRGTTGKDKEHIDVFVKPGTPDNFDGQVFVIDQGDPATGKFDEHKVVLGASSWAEAKQLYLENYPTDWNGGRSIVAMPMREFKRWLKSPKLTAQPIRDYANDIQRAGKIGAKMGDIRRANPSMSLAESERLANEELDAEDAKNQTPPTPDMVVKNEPERTVPTPDTVFTNPLVQQPRSALPIEQNMEMQLRAEKAEADLQIAGRETGRRKVFVESQGQGGTPDVIGLKSAAPDWYTELTTGPRPLKRDTAIQKIIKDHGVDVGVAVERVKEALLRDREFNKTPWGEDADAIMRGEWPSWIEKPDQTETPPTPDLVLTAPQSKLTGKEQKAKVTTASGQTSIDVPPSLIGGKPIIGREAQPEEAPLFSKAEQEPEAEQSVLPDESGRFSNRGNGLNDAAKELRSLSYEKKKSDDVLLDNMRYVPLKDAVRIAREGIESGQVRPFPFQLNNLLGISMGDAGRVLKKDAEQTALPSTPDTVSSHSVKQKEPWEITRDEYATQREGAYIKKRGGSVPASIASDVNMAADKQHKRIVAEALSEGKPVPPEVLADYPGLQPQPTPDRVMMPAMVTDRGPGSSKNAQLPPEPGRVVPKPKVTLDLTDYSPRSKSRYVNATAEYPDGSEYAYQIRVSDHAIDYRNRTGVPPDIFVGVGSREDFNEKQPDYRFDTWGEARTALKEIVAQHSEYDWQEDHPTPAEEARREQARSQNLRRHGIPAEADVPISSFTGTAELKAHQEYTKAKSGDIQSATSLVRDLVKPETVEQAKRFRDAIFVAPFAKEARGENAIPQALAAHYANAAGGQLEDRIIQVNQTFHTGADPMERIIARSSFEGPIQRGASYVLVDDVTTMGGTLSDLAGYIQRNGGKVVGIITLTNAMRSGRLTPQASHLKLIKERFGDVLQQEFGIDSNSLTREEASYLVGFKDADALRARASTANRTRQQRLSAKGLSRPKTGPVTPPQGSSPDSNLTELSAPDRSVKPHEKASAKKSSEPAQELADLFKQESAQAKKAVRPTQPRIPIEPLTGGTSTPIGQIILDLEKGTGKKLTVGKTKPGTAGMYKPGSSATIIKYSGDLDTTAHEMFHALDDQYGLVKEWNGQDTSPFDTELAPFSVHGSSGQNKSATYNRAEGVAEYLRAWMVNPDAAEAAAPQFTAHVKSKLPAEIQKALKTFSTQVRQWHGNTAHAKIMANVQWETPETGLTQWLAGSRTAKGPGFNLTFGDQMAKEWIDPLRPFVKALKYAREQRGLDAEQTLPGNDPIWMARLFMGTNSKLDDIFANGMLDAQLERATPGGLSWLMEPLDQTSSKALEADMQEVASLMIAQRTIEKAEQLGKKRVSGIGAGIEDDVSVAEARLVELRKDEGRFAKLKEAASRYRQWADANIRYLVDKGRLSQEQYETIKANNEQYVAMQRILEVSPGEELAAFMPQGTPSRKLGAVGQPVKTFEGSTRTIKNPYLSLMDATHRSIREADRNEIMKLFRDLLTVDRGLYEGEPNNLASVGREAQTGEQQTIPIFVNGKKEIWQFHPDVYKALKGIEEGTYKLPPFLTILPRILRATIVNTPAFALRNMIRDAWQRSIASLSGSKPWDTLKVYSKEEISQLKRAGGDQAGHYYTDSKNYARALKFAMQEAVASHNSIVVDPAKLVAWSRKGGQGYLDLMQASERQGRMSEYRRAFRKAQKEFGYNKYHAMLYGAAQARGLIDYAIAGNTMSLINQLIPFSNAAVQGLRSNLLRAKADPAGFALRFGAFALVPTLMNYAWNYLYDGDDLDEYRQLPAYQRDLFWNFKLGPDLWLKVPKPFELGVMASSFERMLDYSMGNEKAFDGHVGAFLRTVLPVDDASLAGPYQSWLQAATNYDFFRDRPIVPRWEENLALDLRNYHRASRLGQALQQAVGVDARKIDFLLQSQFGYVGRYAVDLSDTGRKDKHGLTLSASGVTGGSPASVSLDAKEVAKIAEERGVVPSRSKAVDRITNMTQITTRNAKHPDSLRYAVFRKHLNEYYKAESREDRDRLAKQVRADAKHLRELWKKQPPRPEADDKIKKKRALESEYDPFLDLMGFPQPLSKHPVTSLHGLVP